MKCYVAMAFLWVLQLLVSHSHASAISGRLLNGAVFLGILNSARRRSGYSIMTPKYTLPRILQGTPRGEGFNAEAWSTAPHAATGFFQTYLWSDKHWSPGNPTPTSTMSVQVPSQASAVRAVWPHDLQTLNNETSKLLLPQLREYESWIEGYEQRGPYEDIILNQPLFAMTNISSPTTIWIAPKSNMTSVTTGLVVIGPIEEKTGQRYGVGCSIDARSNKAQHMMTQSSSCSLENTGKYISATTSSARSPAEIVDKALPITGSDGNWRHISNQDGLRP